MITKINSYSKQIAKEFDLTPKQVELIVGSVFEVISNVIGKFNKQTITLHSFGTFTPKLRNVKPEYIKYRERINSNRDIKIAKRILKQQLKNDELQGSTRNNEMLGSDAIQKPRATEFSTEED